MLKKTLLAATAAGMIAAGTLATAGAASAAPNGSYGGPYNGQHGGPNGGFQFGGPNWNFQFYSGPQHPPRKVCEPVFKPVKWWDRFGQPHWTKVAVGQKCFFVKPHHNWDGPNNWNGPNWDGGRNYPGPY